MKRQKHNHKHPHKKNHNQSSAHKSSRKPPARRDFFNKVRNGVIAALVVGGGSWFVIEDVMATMGEQDLTRIGNGIPTIVQIHDPQCSQCVALQRQTRKALDNFDKDQLQYLVANIKSNEGRALATKHGVRHVTLLLFDATGKRRQVVNGPNQSPYLTEVFRRHLDKFGRR